MTVIGVTGESEGIVKPYIKKNNIEYLIALGGAPTYRYGGIPHAWLVSPTQQVVWHGHPSRLKDALIKKHLASVKLQPEFKLPKDLKKAEQKLNKGKFAAGMKALERYIENPKSEESRKAAKKALRTTKNFGAEKLKQVDSLAKAGYYADGISKLKEIEKLFRGTELGDKAKKMRSTWQKDKKIKNEIHANALFEEAQAMIQKRIKTKRGLALLKKITTIDKYKNTRAGKEAVLVLKKYGY